METEWVCLPRLESRDDIDGSHSSAALNVSDVSGSLRGNSSGLTQQIRVVSRTFTESELAAGEVVFSSIEVE